MIAIQGTPQMAVDKEVELLAYRECIGIGQIRRHIGDANLAGNNQRNVMLFWR